MNPNRIAKKKSAIVFACVAMVSAGALKTLAQEPAAAKPANFVDLLITGGTVVTMDADRRIIENGYVIVKGDTIIAVGEGLPAYAKRSDLHASKPLKRRARWSCPASSTATPMCP